MSWTHIIDDSRSLKAIYGDKVPDLGAVDLRGVTIESYGRTVIYRFDFVGFPEKPPAKWLSSKYNRVQIQLSFVDVENLEIHGLKKRMEVCLDLKRDESGLVVFAAKAKDVSHFVQAAAAYVFDLTAYQSSTGSFYPGLRD